MELDRGVTSAAEPPITVLVIDGIRIDDEAFTADDRLAVVESNADEGLARLAAGPGEIDCVVVGARGADDRLEILAAARQAAPDLPLILVDDGDGVTPGRALAAGASDVVTTTDVSNWHDLIVERICSLVSDTDVENKPPHKGDGLVELSRQAISGVPVAQLMDEAVALLDSTLDVTYSAVHVFDPEDEHLTLRWGRGWPDDAVGDSTAEVHETTQLGYTLTHGGPVAVENFEPDSPFEDSGLTADDVVGGATAVIGSPYAPYGVLGAYRTGQDGPLTDAARHVGSVAAVLSAAVARRERESELERYERIVETIDDGIYTLDDTFRITWVNQAAVSMLGYSREELVGSHALMLASEETIDEAARISQELLSGDRAVGRLDTELQTATGDRLPIETQFTMLSLGDGRYGQVGVFRDITERKEYERVLTALHDSTRELVRAQTASEVALIIEETATDLLDLSTAVFLFDDDTNLLEPTAVAPNAERAFGGIDPVGPTADSAAWRAFVKQEPVVSEASPGAADSTVEQYFPLGPHGVFAATTDGDADFDTNTKRLTSLLAANAEAALDRIDQEEELRERERERQRQNRRLEQLNQVNEIIRGIDQTLVKAETREEIEQSVCEQLVEDERCAFVWIGMPAPGGEEIVPRAWAGPETGYLDQVSIAATDDANEPTALAAMDRETVVVSNVAERFHDETWRTAALTHDYLSVVSVPLAYGDLFYGVLTVYADEQAAFDEITEAVLGELGETIAYAINSLEAKQSLLSDRSVELDLRFDDDGDLLLRMAKAAGCQLEFREFIPRAGGESTVVFTAASEATEGVLQLEDEFVAIDEIRHVTDREGAALFEATISTSTVTTAIKEYGAVLRSIVADEHDARAVVQLPRDADVRAFVETLKRSVSETELVARRDGNRSTESRDQFQTDLETALTDRQLEVLRAAYRNGYFEWPRQQTGEEVAAGLDISQPTFNRHLRESERKLFTLLFED